MWSENMDKTEMIRKLNDEARRSFKNVQVMLTFGIRMKSEKEVADILERVRTFNNFNKNNDVYGEHDYLSFEYKGEKIIAKIDYYDQNYRYMSENPADPTITNRLLTIMTANEY